MSISRRPHNNLNMTEDEIWNYLADRGAKLGAPFHNGQQLHALTSTISRTGWEILWEFGYLKAGIELVNAGVELRSGDM